MEMPVILIKDLNESLEMVERPAELFVRDGNLYCADHIAIDYYGEYRGGLPYIAEPLLEYAKERGGYWEWENAECIIFVEG